MRDEILDKAIDTDNSIVPRYDVIAPDGTLVATNAQLVLKNPVRTEGTPLNTSSLLSHSTSEAYEQTEGVSLGTSSDMAPNDIFRLIYDLLPRVEMVFPYKANWTVTGSISNNYKFNNTDHGVIVFNRYNNCMIRASDTDDIAIYNTIPVSLSVDTSKIYNVSFQLLNITLHVTSKNTGIIKVLHPIDSSVLDSAEMQYENIQTGYVATVHANYINVQLVLYSHSGDVINSKTVGFAYTDANNTVEVTI